MANEKMKPLTQYSMDEVIDEEGPFPPFVEAEVAQAREKVLVDALRGLLKSSDAFAQKVGWWPDNVSRSSARAILDQIDAEEEPNDGD